VICHLKEGQKAAAAAQKAALDEQEAMAKGMQEQLKTLSQMVFEIENTIVALSMPASLSPRNLHALRLFR
jgi:hypothetical protein